ncbi:hypothetical protein GQX74_008639 [Glossina fuscipes]|nr:hypothetical protein GQX74_008639 [Glossina fuscipes]
MHLTSGTANTAVYPISTSSSSSGLNHISVVSDLTSVSGVGLGGVGGIGVGVGSGGGVGGGGVVVSGGGNILTANGAATMFTTKDFPLISSHPELCKNFQSLAANEIGCQPIYKKLLCANKSENSKRTERTIYV